MSVSVVTIVKGRRAHLLRVLEGLGRGSAPDECVVVEMGASEGPLPPLPFPLRHVVMEHDQVEGAQEEKVSL